MNKVSNQSEGDGPLRAAIYTRVSTKRQAMEGLSLDAQRKRCEGRVEDRKWKLVTVYEERGISGAKDSRPKLDRMLAAAAAGEFDLLVIPKLDRLGRSAKFLLNVYEELKNYGVRIVSVDEGIDATNPYGAAQLGMLAVFAEFEREMIRERVARVRVESREEGIVSPGPALFGYVRKDKKLVIEPRAAKVVRWAFKQAANRTSQREIARKLKANGIKTARGKDWDPRGVSRLLRNATYYGAVVHDGEVLHEDGAHEGIIEKATFDAVQEEARRRDCVPGSSRGRPPIGGHLFTRGLLRCRCGAAMLPRTYRSGVASETYECRRRREEGAAACSQKPIRRELVDPLALAYFQRVGLDLDATRNAWEASVKERTAYLAQGRADAEKTLAQEQANLDRIRGDYRAGKLPVEEWHQFRDELNVSIKAMKAKLKQYDKQAEDLRSDAEVRDAEREVLEALAELRKLAAGAITEAPSIKEMRAALARFFDSFTLAPAPWDEEQWVLAPEFRSGAITRDAYVEYELLTDENGQVVLGEDGHPLPDRSSATFVRPVFNPVELAPRAEKQTAQSDW